MNYSVHAIMYGYYFLTAIKAWPKWLPAHLITIAQISQMIVGTTICVMSYIYLKDDQPCAVAYENVVAGGLMYGSYLYLFAEVRRPTVVIITTTMLLLLFYEMEAVINPADSVCFACFLSFFAHPPPLHYSSLLR